MDLGHLIGEAGAVFDAGLKGDAKGVAEHGAAAQLAVYQDLGENTVDLVKSGGSFTKVLEKRREKDRAQEEKKAKEKDRMTLSELVGAKPRGSAKSKTGTKASGPGFFEWLVSLVKGT